MSVENVERSGTGGAEHQALVSKLKALRMELMTVAGLSDKLREAERALADRDRELQQVRSSVKYTLIKELQVRPLPHARRAGLGWWGTEAPRWCLH